MLDLWAKDHENVRRLLSLLEAELEEVQSGRDVELRLMRDVVFYLTDYVDRVHHPMEDAAFERVAARRGDVGEVLAKLAEAHRVILANGLALLGAIERALADAPVLRRAIEERGQSYCVELRSHMALEEGELFPVLAGSISDEEWGAIVRETRPPEDPLFGGSVEERYRELLRELESRGG